jgi:hypothetical protein
MIFSYPVRVGEIRLRCTIFEEIECTARLPQVQHLIVAKRHQLRILSKMKEYLDTTNSDGPATNTVTSKN